jgi:hypothetical protein
MNTDKIKEHDFLNSRESAGYYRNFFAGEMCRGKEGILLKKILFHLILSYDRGENWNLPKEVDG